jgi:hypothetical protein
MISAPVDADLLKASSWTNTNRIRYDPAWTQGNAWLEGNAVVTPSGDIVDILRVNRQQGETAAIVRISSDGKNATFNTNDFISFPGGNTKFTIRFDNITKSYWSLVNKQKNPAALRNILCLTNSLDLKNWRVVSTVLHSDDQKNAFQYVDWQFEGDDIIFASRTAFDGAHSYHDANYLTFHRIKQFRKFVL